MWGNAVRIASLSGVDVKVDASWLLVGSLVIWSLMTGYFPAEVPDVSPMSYVAMAVIGLAGFVASILLHELAHASLAQAQGVHVTGITLFLFGGVAEINDGHPTPLTEIWIAIAGPIASLGLALCLFVSARLAQAFGPYEAAAAVFAYLSLLNLFLGLGNLIPAFPLDGGCILRALLWMRSGDLVDATQKATRISVMFSVALIVLGLVSAFSGDTAGGLWPVMIGLFLLATARQSTVQLLQAAALDGRTVADLMSRDPSTVRPDQSLSELVGQVFLENGVSFAPVVEDGVVLGYVDAQIVRRIDRDNWTTTSVDDVLESVNDENCVSPDMPGRDLLERIGLTGRRKFMVVEGTALVGVVTLADLTTFLKVSEDLRQPAL